MLHSRQSDCEKKSKIIPCKSIFLSRTQSWKPLKFLRCLRRRLWNVQSWKKVYLQNQYNNSIHVTWYRNCSNKTSPHTACYWAVRLNCILALFLSIEFHFYFCWLYKNSLSTSFAVRINLKYFLLHIHFVLHRMRLILADRANLYRYFTLQDSVLCTARVTYSLRPWDVK